MNAFRIDRDLRSIVGTRKVGKGADEREVSYLSWLTALGMGRGEGVVSGQTVLEDSPGQVVRKVFGGGLVGVEEDGQRLYLPVLIGGEKAAKFGEMNSRQVGNTVARCRAKLIACCTGIGLDIYMGYKGNGPDFAKRMGTIGPDSDLSKVQAYIKKKGAISYISWPAAIAAAKLADQGFLWSVEERDMIDRGTGEIVKVPFVPIGTGFAVGVTVHYRGLTHTEWLPVLGRMMVNGKNQENQPLTDPSAWHWNRSVMRCLTKAIAIISGYGLDLYAKTDLAAQAAADADSEADPVATAPAADRPAPATASQEAPKPAQPVAPAAKAQTPVAATREEPFQPDQNAAAASQPATPTAPTLTVVPDSAPDEVEPRSGDSINTLIHDVQHLSEVTKTPEKLVMVMLHAHDYNQADVVNLEQVRRMLRAKQARMAA